MQVGLMISNDMANLLNVFEILRNFDRNISPDKKVVLNLYRQRQKRLEPKTVTTIFSIL